jgi:L-alanine-DL-glutamate epimerase-like enolase superfamily enzyme
MSRSPLGRREFLKAIPVFSAVSLPGASRSKITDVRNVRLKVAKETCTYPDWVGGTLFSRAGGGAIVEIHKSMLAGADPFDIDAHAARLSAMPASGLRGPASVEIALWDLIGKLTNQPLYKLWGGGREKVPPYSSRLRLGTPEERGGTAAELKADGWQAVKWRCSFATLKNDVRLIERMRKTAGDD